jgi:hypothetical protein
MEDEVAALVCHLYRLNYLVSANLSQVIDNGSGMCKAGCEFLVY